MPRDPQLERRMENVRVLLRTLHDIYPGPTAIRQDASTSGSAPSSRVPCTLCARTGRVRGGRLCPLCEGSGWRKRRAGDPEFDEYTGAQIATEEAPRKAVAMSPARLDAELARIQHDLILREGQVDLDEQFSWERAREARDRGASYRELERVLDVMQIDYPIARSAITSCYFGLGTSLPRSVDDALVEWIATRMRGPVKIPKDAYEAQQEELRRQARAMFKAGCSEEQVRDELGVSRRFTRAVLAGTLQVSNSDRSPASVIGPASAPRPS